MRPRLNMATEATGKRRAHSTRGDESAESIQRQYLWNTPNGGDPDFSESFTDGAEILISWNALNNSVYDLWLTSWNTQPSPVALRLASKSSSTATCTRLPCPHTLTRR